jgi:hypothetical protein
MGITVFLLICGPFAALLFFPLTTRQQLRPAHARNAPESTAAPAKDFQSIPLNRGADDHSRKWKNVA